MKNDRATVSQGVLDQMADVAWQVLGPGFNPGILYGLCDTTFRKWEHTDRSEADLPAMFEKKLRNYLTMRGIKGRGAASDERILQSA